MTPPVVVISGAQRRIRPQDQRIFRIAMLCRSTEVIAAGDDRALLQAGIDHHDFIMRGSMPVVIA